MFGWGWKSEGKEKMSLNKFTHIPLLKNDVQLEQKKWQITTKRKKEKKQSPKFIKINKNHVPKKKKSHLVKKKKSITPDTRRCPCLENQKKKEKK